MRWIATAQVEIFELCGFSLHFFDLLFQLAWNPGDVTREGFLRKTALQRYGAGAAEHSFPGAWHISFQDSGRILVNSFAGKRPAVRVCRCGTGIDLQNHPRQFLLRAGGFAVLGQCSQKDDAAPFINLADALGSPHAVYQPLVLFLPSVKQLISANSAPAARARSSGESSS